MDIFGDKVSDLSLSDLVAGRKLPKAPPLPPAPPPPAPAPAAPGPLSGFDRLYGDRNAEAFDREFKSPPPPSPTSFSAWSALSAGAKGVPAGGLEIGASVSEGLSIASNESMRARRPRVLGDQPDDSDRRSRDAVQIDQAGPALRQEAATFAPPETAHTADQVLYGLGRIGTKAVVATALPGGVVMAGTALAAEETNTQFHDLTAKGIDPNTALKVAGVQGVAAGLSVALPMVGPTIKSTVGLVLASGPGTYVAQETLAKNILQKAGYQNEASLHNPTDPLGLALSIAIPAAVGGVHIAGLAKPTLATVVRSIESEGNRFAKDGSELQGPATRFGTAKGDMQVLDSTARDPGHGIAPAKTLADGSIDPAERARVGVELIGKLQDKYGSPDKAMAAYNWGEGNLDKAIAKHGDAWLDHAPAETQKYVAKGLKQLGDDVVAHGASTPEVVEAARVRVTQDALARSMPEHSDAHVEVMRASEEIAAGRMPEVESLTTVWHGSPHEFDAFSTGRIGSGEGIQAFGHGLYFAESEGVARSYRDALGEGKVDGAPFNPNNGRHLAASYMADFGGDQARAIKDIDARLAKLGDAPMSERAPLETARGVIEKGGDIPAYEASGAVYKVAIPTRHIEKMIDLDAPMRDQPKAVQDAYRELGAYFPDKPMSEHMAVDRAMAGKLLAEGIPGIKYLDGASRKAGEGARNYVLFDDKIPSIVERNGQPIARSEGANALPPADHVATGAAPKPTAPTAEPGKPAEKPPTLQEESAARVDAIAAENPELKVTLPGETEPMTVTEALAKARDEMADELEEQNWVQAAVSCALSFGG